MNLFQHNTLVWKWAVDTPDNADFSHILGHVRQRRDMPNQFPHKTYFIDYLARTGCSDTTGLDMAWRSYRAYVERATLPRIHKGAPALSRSEAKRLGKATFVGQPCTKGPHHGTIRRTNNGECLACHKEYRKRWSLRRSGVESRVMSELTDEERRIFEAALTKTSRRA